MATKDPILRIEEHILRLEKKLDGIFNTGCPFGRATKEQANRNSAWIRIGIIGLFSLLGSFLVAIGVGYAKWLGNFYILP